MNNKEECSIVQDLAIAYTEKRIQPESKGLIERHLKNCKDCKKYYEIIEDDLFEQKQKEKKKDKQELDFLGKFRKRMNRLKITLILIVVTLVALAGSVFIKYQKIEYIVNQAYARIEKMKSLNNYQLTEETIHKDFSEEANSYDVTTNYYYKDGKYKVQYATTTLYLEDDSYHKTCVFDDLKQIEYHMQNFIEQKKGEIFNLFSEILSYKNLKGMNLLWISERTDNFQGIECYVMRMGNENSYRDTWIDKDNFNVIRVVNEDKGKFYSEEIFTFSQDMVTDEEVDSSILNTEKYQDYRKLELTTNVTDEIKHFYEIRDGKSS